MMRVVERHLAQREVRLAVEQVRPDEHHRRAGRGRQDDQAGDVAVDLVGRQQGRNRQPMNSQPSSAIENGLTAQLTNRVTPMPRQCRPTSPQRGEVDLEQHRHDHQPDQGRHRQVDLRDLGAAEGVEQAPGKSWPRAMPATMQSATQRVR